MTSGLGRWLMISVATCAALASCGPRERILQGERLDIRGAADGNDASGEKRHVDRLKLPAARVNADWTHKNGTPQHLIRHPALNQQLTKLWSANIGSGNSRKSFLTASPIVAGGRVYTMDANSGVRAFTLNGAPLWSVDLTPPHEKANEASGGGLAYGNGVLVATTGHGQVVVMDPASGAIRWQHKMTGAISAAPAIAGNVVIAISRNNVAQGLDIKNGRILWQQLSSGDIAGVAGAGAPAVLGKLAVLPYSSGEIVGAVTDNGVRAWSSAVTGRNKTLARSLVSDISGDPVIDGQRLYVANQAGRLAALDRRNGERLWTVQDGSYTPVWPAGGAVFMITDSFAVKRLNASDGSEVWSVELPDFKERKDRRKKNAYAYYGPVLAGGQLWVAGSDGVMRSYNPKNGALTGTVDIPGGAASQPAIAGGRLYILSSNGQLHAYQ